MQLQAQVYGTNTLDRHVVLSQDPAGKNMIEWHAAGSPSGQDVQVIPMEVLNTAQFQRLLTRGIIVITDDLNDPSVIQALNGQRQAWEARGALASAQAQQSILREQDNDLVQVYCCGPDARGAEGKCGTPVPVRESKMNEAPALCAQHAGLKSQFISTEVEQRPGVPESKITVWKRMATTTAVREIAVG